MPRTIPKVCPIQVLVLLGSVRPCSLPPVRTLPFKTKKKKRLLILGGDWNCIGSELDLLDPAGNPAHRFPGYWDGLRAVEAEHDLLDVWRARNGNARTFTHISRSSGTSARLDRWLLSEALRAWVSSGATAVSHTVGYPGDHLGITLSITAPGRTSIGGGA